MIGVVGAVGHGQRTRLAGGMKDAGHLLIQLRQNQKAAIADDLCLRHHRQVEIPGGQGAVVAAQTAQKVPVAVGPHQREGQGHGVCLRAGHIAGVYPCFFQHIHAVVAEGVGTQLAHHGGLPAQPLGGDGAQHGAASHGDAYLLQYGGVAGKHGLIHRPQDHVIGQRADGRDVKLLVHRSSFCLSPGR